MGEPLVDRFARVHRDLRISLTDRCSLRCTYCMPEQGNEWLARQSILTLDEIVEVATVAAAAGITTFRLTGGEPLLRTDIVEIVRRLAAIASPDGPIEIAMTTNGIRLPEVLPDLVAAGLARLNISLDTLDRERFRNLTRRDRLDEVLDGVRAAQASGLRPLKINAVAMRGVNDDELADLVAFAVAHDAQMRFIEQMPLDAGHTWDRSSMVTREEILEALAARWSLEPVPGRGGAPAERWRLDGGPHTVGVIASVTAPFCGACDRMRLTADGQLRNCLFSIDEYDLLPVLRSETPPEARAERIDRVLRNCIAGKKAGHAIDDPGFLQPARGMNAIGG
ncbi:GTP 3',8-cyclase MoaA [Microbacterium sp. AISO3]|jgi:GTP 3',8-cyclase|uniref:GTP 3',8-cyclase n=1 Tax=Microbacterium arborescens TaxID=33883 RepID=A0ABX2WHY4_9MICO|nr:MULTISPECIES: GTP 3',8-cyclase MoaA [Microbacterium]OAZ40826.1 cyclic pyranopterin phosphate synthase [Microbacterium arborescens]OWP21166.1 GTP 3',8-cyclase MoaA [Microbacterium sp. AISO3]POX67581.1 GTP 3',8-cyclase MoaA [Microbacterium sp. Ru50]QCR39765.1 GTP 3',8-cyclase MoaA [Microbacterium sp. SGAir0570]GAD33638.1 molybdenum cofactor biosynthesis protein A [Microbacterium sp. TS-1]